VLLRAIVDDQTHIAEIDTARHYASLSEVAGGQSAHK
jgi:hypothetical protein